MHNSLPLSDFSAVLSGSQTNGDGGSNTGLIVGVVLGSFFAFLFVVIVALVVASVTAVIVRKRRQRKSISAVVFTGAKEDEAL